MSYAVDLNILLYASDQKSPFHEQARLFLADCATRAETFCLAWPTLLGYLRIVTHPSIFSAPLSQIEAEENVEALLSLPQVRLLSEGSGFWGDYQEATAEVEVRGNLVPDAHLAALLLQHGVRTLYSNDSDFEQFGFLDLRNPFKP